MGAMFRVSDGRRGRAGARWFVWRRRGVREPKRKDAVPRRMSTLFPNERRPAGHLDGARGWMPAIWRPNVRVSLDEDVDVDAETEHASKKGTKRKRAPNTKGPSEHGVKYPSNCKVCSACPHGKKRSECKECGGASICEHGRVRSKCKGTVGLKSASTVVSAPGARRAVVVESASTVVGALIARRAVGVKSASTVVSALSARNAAGLKSASTVVSADSCKECGGASICEHGRQHRCKECGGAQSASTVVSKCKECGGGGICEHGRVRY